MEALASRESDKGESERGVARWVEECERLKGEVEALKVGLQGEREGRGGAESEVRTLRAALAAAREEGEVGIKEAKAAARRDIESALAAVARGKREGAALRKSAAEEVEAVTARATEALAVREGMIAQLKQELEDERVKAAAAHDLLMAHRIEMEQDRDKGR